MKMIKWKTGDTCPTCGHDGMTFIYDRIEPACDIFGDPTVEYFGTILCDNPSCSFIEEVSIDAYQIPDNRAIEIMETEGWNE